MRFRGRYGFLSMMCSCDITYKGLTYHSGEAAFHAQKCANEEDKLQFTEIIDPVKAKHLGYKVKKVDNWEDIKLKEMYNINLIKYTQDGIFTEKLLNTGLEELVEDNTHGDIYWGRCNGVGENYLGRIIMLVRQRIRTNINETLYKMSCELSGYKPVDISILNNLSDNKQI